jgi:hypothetical protein
VIQGTNDPRVPKVGSDQIVERVRARGVEVSYLVFDDEGHALTSRDNDIRANSAVARFLVEHLALQPHFVMCLARGSAFSPVLDSRSPFCSDLGAASG